MKEIFVSVVQTFNTNWNEKNISTPFVVIFLIGIYYIYRTNKRDLKAVFVYPVLIYIIIIFNPFMNWIFNVSEKCYKSLNSIKNKLRNF